MSAARLHTALCVGAVLFLIAYLIPIFGPHLELWYMPYERRWVLGPKPPGIGMEWYARTLVALVAGGVGTGLALLATRGSTRTEVSRIWSVILALSVLVAMVVYAYVYWTRKL
jgi:hypothetical protein